MFIKLYVMVVQLPDKNITHVIKSEPHNHDVNPGAVKAEQAFNL